MNTGYLLVRTLPSRVPFFSSLTINVKTQAKTHRGGPHEGLFKVGYEAQ
jgi:hypothetical protein